VINSKNDYFTKLSSNIVSESRGSKQYWNIIKLLMNYDSADSRSIPPLQVDGDLICDNKEKARFVINLTLMILISSPQIYFLDNREVLDI
jgi:hypothetical protein